jgi:hypothetical protein
MTAMVIKTIENSPPYKPGSQLVNQERNKDSSTNGAKKMASKRVGVAV